jgi:hypothetical protein
VTTRPKKLRDKEKAPAKADTRLGRAEVQTFIASDYLNQMLIEHLEPSA